MKSNWQKKEERRKNGDIFYPNFNEYISTIDEAKKISCCFIIKAQTHMIDNWEWSCCLKKDNI
jgi:hypothetical protein